MSTRAVVCLCVALAACVPAISAVAADDRMTTRLATCQDSWLDWKDDPLLGQKFVGAFRAAFTQKDKEPYFVPKTALTVAGLRVERAFPESVGMGVGFSVVVNAGFDATRKAVEKEIGKTLPHCETSDGMRTCELDIAPRRSLTVMADDKPRSKSTLIGCFYFYAK